ncbi:MAG: hypothetical protein AAF401_06110 [Pseudomonadota bacterium]
MTTAEFADFQCIAVAEKVPGFNPDLMLCVAELINEDNSLAETIFIMDADYARYHADMYRQHVDFDGYRRLKAFNRGRFVSFDQMISAPSCQGNQPMVEVFEKIGVTDSMNCCYTMPTYKSRVFYINYLFLNGNTADRSITTYEVEYVTLPFLLAWLLLAGYIDLGRYDEWSAALCALTPMQLFVLRDLLNAKRYSAEAVASKYGISRRTLETHVANIHSAKCGLLGEAKVEGNASRIPELINLFEFLRFSGAVGVGPLNEPQPHTGHYYQALTSA